MNQTRDLWVFGYGSLMWEPGFVPADRRLARLDGHARRFCLHSIRYRGTPEAPGLVLGLDPEPGAACEGVAFRVAPETAETVTAYLRARELVTYAYREAVLPVRLQPDGTVVEALVYVVDPTHPQYAGGLSLIEQARIIASRAGPSGSNRAYFDNTLAHLAACGVVDPELDRLARIIERF